MSTPNDVLAEKPVPITTEPELYDLEARGKWVLIRMLSREERISTGGIVLSQAQAKTQHGIVESVDSSVVKDLDKGDLVIFTNFTNEVSDVEELTARRDLHLVREEEIYAKAKVILDQGRLRLLRLARNARAVAASTEEPKEIEN